MAENEPTSKSFLERLVRGDSRAWEKFHELYQKRIERKAYEVLCGIRPDSEWGSDGRQRAREICDEVVSHVYLGVIRFQRQREGSFRVWLDKVVRNFILTELRQIKKRPEHWPPEAIDRVCKQLASDGCVLEVLSREDNNKRLADLAIALMEERYSAEEVAIYLRLARDEKKPREVAAEFGVPRERVYALRYEMTREMSELMEDCLADFRD